MSQCFRACRWIQTAFVAAGLLAAFGVYWLRLRSLHIVLAILFGALSVGVGYMLGRVFAIACGNRFHAELLQILNHDLDPVLFVRRYEPVADRCKPGSAEHAIAQNHLAKGYAMLGEFDRALSLVQSLDLAAFKHHRLNLLSLCKNNLCQIALWAGDGELAAQYFEELSELCAESKTRAPGVHRFLCDNLAIYRQQLNLILGEPVDIQVLRELLQYCTTPLQNHNMQYIIALSSRDEQEARNLFCELSKSCAKLVFGSLANDHLKGRC